MSNSSVNPPLTTSSVAWLARVPFDLKMIGGQDGKITFGSEDNGDRVYQACVFPLEPFVGTISRFSKPKT
ncbi:hypothetical protein SCOR_10375 [Sulfidibacter corallicola]|uniref:Uncharacterized protein n=1 Tax=Sulfidibacter corallicola TaxID=2818388 RepID=A0A8A4TE73_SULCO|nr:hypothetical protein [Sulfidibacter corallicola]QTD48256.1 hypothetical protein J3U87_21950 [Sulfidibacter corallicola]